MMDTVREYAERRGAYAVWRPPLNMPGPQGFPAEHQDQLVALIRELFNGRWPSMG